jgi:hypothetical protein
MSQQATEEPQETPENVEEPDEEVIDEASEETDGTEDEIEGEPSQEVEKENESEEIEEPDIYNFTDSTDYTAGKITAAYEEKSSWNEIEGILSEEETSWTDRVKSYLFETENINSHISKHDKEYSIGGISGIGSGFLAGSLGYTATAGLMMTGGIAALGIGAGSYIMKKLGYFEDQDKEGPEQEESEIDHPLEEYSEWEVEILDHDAYEEAMEEYAEALE